MPSKNNDIVEITPQDDVQAYFDETYGEPAKLLASPSKLSIAIKNVNPPILLSPHSQTVSSIDNLEDGLVSPLATPRSQKNTRRLTPPKLTSPPTELNLYELDQQGLLSPNISTPSSSSRANSP